MEVPSRCIMKTKSMKEDQVEGGKKKTDPEKITDSEARREL